MRSSVALLLLALLIGLTPAARADRPNYALALELSDDRVELGRSVTVDLKLTKRTGKPIEVNALRLARNSISLRVIYGEKTRTVTRIYGTVARGAEDKYVVKDEPAPRATLKRGKPLKAELPLLAIRTGKMKVQAVYTGLDAGPPVLESEEVELEVRAPGDATELAAEITTSEGRMLFSLFPDRAYGTVHNFATLAADKVYDGLTFHRVMKGFMIQGGDPKGNGSGGPGWYIPAEFDPELRHVKGILSMARTPAPNSAGSQFFVMDGTNTGLDGRSTAFGRLLEGEEVLDKLADTEVVANSRSGEKSTPVKKPVIKTIRLVPR